jgi:hypothetical protein
MVAALQGEEQAALRALDQREHHEIERRKRNRVVSAFNLAARIVTRPGSPHAMRVRNPGLAIPFLRRPQRPRLRLGKSLISLARIR